MATAAAQVHPWATHQRLKDSTIRVGVGNSAPIELKMLSKAGTTHASMMANTTPDNTSTAKG